MQLRHIEACHAVFQTRAMSRAARLLNISQPAVSKLIKHAEQQLGFRLFDRVKGRLVPTREAQALAPQVESVFRQLEQLRRLEQNLVPTTRGRIRLGCLPSLGLQIVPRAISAFQRSFPDVEHEVRTYHSEGLVEALIAQELDVAFSFDVKAQVGVRIEELGEAELVYVRRKPLAPEVRWSDVATSDRIGLTESDAIGAIIERKLREEGAVAAPRIEVQTYYLACALADEGCGGAVVDAFTARSFRGQNLAVARLRPATRFAVVAMFNDLNPPPRACLEVVKAFRSACGFQGKQAVMGRPRR